MLTVNSDRLEQLSNTLLNTVCEMSDVYMGEGRFDDALALLGGDALAHMHPELLPEGRLRLKVQQARVKRYRCWLTNSGHDDVLEILGEAREAAEALNDRTYLADIVDLTGEVIYLKELWQSKLEPALEHFRQALRLREKTKDDRGIAASLLHIGWVYQHKADADEEDALRAFEHFQTAYNMAKDGHFRIEQAEAARHLADMHRRKGELDEALAGHLEFVSLAKEVGYRIFLPPGYTMVGISYLMKGELDQALESCEKARCLALDLDSQWFLAESLFGIGAAKEAKGDKRGALGYYQQALAAGEAAGFELVVGLASSKLESLTNSQG